MTPLPDDLSFAQGATLGIPGMTAWCCLFATARSREDGACHRRRRRGRPLCRAAREMGRRAGDRDRQFAAKAEQARLAGADLMVNYRTEDVVAKAMAFTGGAASIASSMSISAAISRPR